MVINRQRVLLRKYLIFLDKHVGRNVVGWMYSIKVLQRYSNSKSALTSINKMARNDTYKKPSLAVSRMMHKMTNSIGKDVEFTDYLRKRNSGNMHYIDISLLIISKEYHRYSYVLEESGYSDEVIAEYFGKYSKFEYAYHAYKYSKRNKDER